MKSNKKSLVKSTVTDIDDYGSILKGLVNLIEDARRFSVKTVNAVMTATYWEIGRRIVEHEQQGKKRAGYGEELLKLLSADLTKQYGRGFSARNLRQMRQFYLSKQIWQTVSAKSDKSPIRQTPSAKLTLQEPASRFPLPWSSYVSLLSIKNNVAQDFYEKEALRGGWSVRQLNRQINSMFYERTALSKNKVSMLKKGEIKIKDDIVSPEEEIKDPYVLEFLSLKDEYSETDLEEALIFHMEKFLIELGNNFAFVGRQKRLRIGDEWYRVDLLFFHRKLRCLVVVDLKIGKFTHADAGQMNMYLNYVKEHLTNPDENPPVGLILCAQKDDSLAKYALSGLSNKVMASEYKTILPDENLLVQELEKTQKMLENVKQK